MVRRRVPFPLPPSACHTGGAGLQYRGGRGTEGAKRRESTQACPPVPRPTSRIPGARPKGWGDLRLNSPGCSGSKGEMLGGPSPCATGHCPFPRAPLHATPAEPGCKAEGTRGTEALLSHRLRWQQSAALRGGPTAPFPRPLRGAGCPTLLCPGRSGIPLAGMALPSELCCTAHGRPRH